MIRSVPKVALRLSNKPVISTPKRQLSGNLCGLQTLSTSSVCFLRTIPGATIRFNSTFEKNGGNSSVDNSPATKSDTNTANSAPYYIPKIPKTTMAAQQSLRRFPSATSSAAKNHVNITDFSSFLQQNAQHDANNAHKSSENQEHSNQFKASYQPCTTISTSERYDLVEVIDAFYAKGLRSASIILPGEVAHAQYPYAPGLTADVLVISNGSLVVWGMNEKDVLDKIVPIIKTAEINSYAVPESEDMDYVEESFSESNTSRQANSHPSNSLSHNIPEFNERPNDKENFSEEHAILKTDESQITHQETQHQTMEHSHHDPDPEYLSDVSHLVSRSTMAGDVIVIRGDNYTSRLLAKAAFSSGLARSTKLANLEYVLDKHITTTKKYIDNLATGRELGIRAKTVLRLTGQLLSIRGQLNLYSELIETPDLYWSEPELEELYTLISKKLDVVPRIAILNKKLDYASESLSTLRSHISEENSVRLEWMIIILIMVEVAFEITHFVEKYHERAGKVLGLTWGSTEDDKPTEKTA